MSTFGEDLIQTLNEALAHAKGEGLATVHTSGSLRQGGGCGGPAAQDWGERFSLYVQEVIIFSAIVSTVTISYVL